MTEDSRSTRSRPEWKPEDLARNHEIVEKHTTGLAAGLASHVRQMLEKEARTEEVSQSLIDDAYYALRAALPERDARDLEALKAARQQAIESLDRTMRLDVVSQEEVEDHARAVARCMVTNWLFLIKLRYQDQHRMGNPVLLNSTFLPQSDRDRNAASVAQLKKGFAVFAAEPDAVLRMWQSYLARQFAEQSSVPVSAKLTLVKDEQAYRVVPASDLLAKRIAATVLPQRVRNAESVSTSADLLELRRELEYLAARAAAAGASGTSSDLILNQKFKDWADSEPDLVSAMAKFILLEDELGDPEGNHASDVELLRQRAQLEALFDKVTPESEPWNRAYRITKLATAFTYGVDQGVLEFEMHEENQNLQRYYADQNLEVAKVALHGSIVVMAQDVARQAVDMLRQSGRPSNLFSHALSG